MENWVMPPMPSMLSMYWSVVDVARRSSGLLFHFPSDKMCSACSRRTAYIYYREAIFL